MGDHRPVPVQEPLNPPRAASLAAEGKPSGS